MRAFEIQLNGRKVCTAGIGLDGVMTAIVTLATGKGPMELHLHDGGLVSCSKERLRRFGGPLHGSMRFRSSSLMQHLSTNRGPESDRIRPRTFGLRRNTVRAVMKQLGRKIQTNPK